jgi:flagellar hook assembly protein FlgD
MRVLFVSIAALLVAPASALAAGPTMTVRDVPLHGSRTLAAASPRFDMVAVHWRGSGSVLLRTRSSAGRWSRWQAADADTGPDAASAENRLRSWHLGNVVWTGASDAVRFRTRGRVTALRAYYVWSPTELLPMRRLSVAGSPPIIPRAGWGANEAIRRHPPHYAPAVTFAVVHHTDGSNNYTPAQSAAIIRGIELYHVEGNGWDDIGYNFLVDKYGQVFEGRAGGIDRPVVGAHSLGFNRGSVGVAVLGTYDSAPISAAAKTALEDLLAWRLDVAHVDPLSTVVVPSLGNPRFPKGVPVPLRAISGHRDTGFTDCPGDALYAELPQIAKDVAALGLPKLYAPVVTGRLGGPIRFTGRLTTDLPWTVTVTNAAGATVAQGTGTGIAVDWTWDATLAPPDKYTWTITAPDVRPATGTVLGPKVTLAVRNAKATPTVLSPGGDPSDDTTTVTYTLSEAATVTATLLDPNGQTVTTLFTDTKTAGKQSFTFTAQSGLPNGAYTIQITAVAANGATVTVLIPLTVDDTLDAFTVAPTLFSAARGGSVDVSFTLRRGPVTVALQVLRGKKRVASPVTGTYGPGRVTIEWRGTLDRGKRAPDGVYTIALSVTDGATVFTRTGTVTLDSTPPKVTVLSYRALSFRVSEPATVTLVVGDARYTHTLKKAGTTQFVLPTRPTAFQLLATDAAGNTSTLRYPRR